MRDPHVATLRYRLVTDDTVSFDNPHLIDWPTPVFRLRLANGVAEVEMVEHCASEREARERVDAYLRDYEVYAALSLLGSLKIHFEFDKTGTVVIDRDPAPPGSPLTRYVDASGSLRGRGKLSAKGMVVLHQYPSPPDSFVMSPDAETLWHLYAEYLSGRKPLAHIAYYCLSLLESRAVSDSRAKGRGKRHKSASLYGIDWYVLHNLGRLASVIGDDQTGRKVASRPHTHREIAWLEAAVRALILRVGQWAANPNAPLPQLMMKDLPPLAD